MITSYTVTRDENNVTWVNIEPLMADLAEALVQLEQLPYDGLSTQGKAELDLKILNTAALYQFFGALKNEYDLKLLKQQHEGKAND